MSGDLRESAFLERSDDSENVRSFHPGKSDSRPDDVPAAVLNDQLGLCSDSLGLAEHLERDAYPLLDSVRELPQAG